MFVCLFVHTQTQKIMSREMFLSQQIKVLHIHTITLLHHIAQGKQASLYKADNSKCFYNIVVFTQRQRLPSGAIQHFLSKELAVKLTRTHIHTLMSVPSEENVLVCFLLKGPLYHLSHSHPTKNKQNTFFGRQSL